MKWKIENLIPIHCSANQALSSDMHIVVLGRIVWPFFSIMCKKTRFSEKRYDAWQLSTTAFSRLISLSLLVGRSGVWGLPDTYSWIITHTCDFIENKAIYAILSLYGGQSRVTTTLGAQPGQNRPALGWNKAIFEALRDIGWQIYTTQSIYYAVRLWNPVLPEFGKFLEF